MTIGVLYNAANVVVGQAACFFAPANTPLPDISLTALVSPALVDPFDVGPWTTAKLAAATGTITGGTFTITYTYNGTAYTTSALTGATVTAAQIDTAITNALAPLGVLTTDVIVTGGPVSAVATPVSISVSEAISGGTWSITPTGITGGTLSITNPLWVPCGATDQGWKFTANKSTQDINIEEQTTPVARTMTTQAFTVEAALSEDIGKTLDLVFNMVSSYTANSSGHAGFMTHTLTDSVIQYAVALVMANQLGLPRWLYIPVAVQLTNSEGTLRRAAAKRMYNAQFSSICATGQIIFEDVLQRGS